MEGLFEEFGQEKEGRTLVKSVSVMVNQTAATTGEVVFLEDGYRVTCLCESSCSGYTSYSGTCLQSCQYLYFYAKVQALIMSRGARMAEVVMERTSDNRCLFLFL